MNNEEYQIHIKENAPDYQDVLIPLFKDHSTDFKPPLLKRDTTVDEVVRSFAENDELIYATRPNETEILGFLLINPQGKRDVIKEKCPCPYINLALVHQEHRNSGIGKQLLKSAEKRYKNTYSNLSLRTRSDNLRMKNLCEKIGFKKQGSEIDNNHKRIYYSLKLDSKNN